MSEIVKIASAVRVIVLTGRLAAEVGSFDRRNDGGQRLMPDIGKFDLSQDFSTGERNSKADSQLSTNLILAFQQEHVHGLAVVVLPGEIIGFDLRLVHPVGLRHGGRSLILRDDFPGSAQDGQAIAQRPDDHHHAGNDDTPERQ
jgi:hypothetical protein